MDAQPANGHCCLRMRRIHPTPSRLTRLLLLNDERRVAGLVTPDEAQRIARALWTEAKRRGIGDEVAAAIEAARPRK